MEFGREKSVGAANLVIKAVIQLGTSLVETGEIPKAPLVSPLSSVASLDAPTVSLRRPLFLLYTMLIAQIAQGLSIIFRAGIFAVTAADRVIALATTDRLYTVTADDIPIAKHIAA